MDFITILFILFLFALPLFLIGLIISCVTDIFLTQKNITPSLKNSNKTSDNTKTKNMLAGKLWPVKRACIDENGYFRFKFGIGVFFDTKTTPNTTKSNWTRNEPIYKKILPERKTYIDENGYMKFKDSDILVHRYFACKKIGRRLRYGEVVHHIDGNKLNNSLDNLQICKSQSEHEMIHYSHLKNYGTW